MGIEQGRTPPKLCLPVTPRDLAAIRARIDKAKHGYAITIETGDTGQPYVCVESDVDHRTVIFAADDRHRHWGALDWRGEVLMAGPSIEGMIETSGEYLIA